MKPLDLIDIGLHAALATAWGALVALSMLWGVTMPAAIGLLILGAVFWLVRELYQHNWRFGGTQSQLEWIVPAIAAPIAFFVTSFFIL
jgi:hypothetical protein